MGYGKSYDTIYICRDNYGDRNISVALSHSMGVQYCWSQDRLFAICSVLVYAFLCIGSWNYRRADGVYYRES